MREDDSEQDWYGSLAPSGYPPPPPPPPPPLPPPPPAQRHRRLRAAMYLLGAALIAVLSAGITVALSHHSGDDAIASAQGDLPAPRDNAPGTASGSLNRARVEHAVVPGLVDITARLKYDSETAEGTGMIVSPNGLVLTNNHVIDNSTSLTAQLVNGGRVYQARVLGYDASADVALLQLVGASRLPVVAFGNSSELSVGTPVLALGNAEGRGGITPAQGIISALGRSIDASDQGSNSTEDLSDMEQTNAQIQQGDSGGALANNAGQVIGMITAANTSGGQQGTAGFAIPINTARTIAQQIASGQPSTAVYIGVPGFLGVVVPSSRSANPHHQARDEQHYLQTHQGTPGPSGPGSEGVCIDISAQVSVPIRVAPTASGVLIVDIFCGTPLNQAGLLPGDVITAVNGSPVTVPSSLGGLLHTYHPGQIIKLSWTDTGGARHHEPITLGPGPVR